MNLYFLQFNNYYNRIIKKFDTIQEYTDYILESFVNINFIPGDDITTTQIINWNKNEKPDYMIAVDEFGNINSRWWITDHRRTRNGQYNFFLRRDIISDNYQPLLEAPMFIEKATLDDSDPMIFNSENMTFNQIKQSETLLKDKTGSAWIVGYLATESSNQDPYSVSVQDETFADIVIDSLNNWDYIDYNNKTYSSKLNDYSYNVFAEPNILSRYYWYKYSFNENGQKNTLYGTVGTYRGSSNDQPLSSNYSLSNKGSVNVNNLVNRTKLYADELKNQIYAYYEIGEDSFTNAYLELKDKIMYVTDTQKFYKISITNKGQQLHQVPIRSGSMFNTLKNVISGFFDGQADSNSFVLNVYTQDYVMKLTEINEIGIELTISTDRYHLKDAPYDMFAIPFSDDLDIYQNGTKLFTSNSEYGFKIAMALSKKYGSESAKFLYDLQLLPYCPVRYCLQEDGTFDIKDFKVDYIKNSSDDSNVGIVLFAQQSSFTLNIQQNIIVENKKIESQTDIHRLCSPNYNGVFQFNAAKNNGVDYFNVDCTYKPYNPYIHINPNFKELYGNDFNDSRGLVVGGDFSLPQITNAWESYQLSNKNYQLAFDRQITNMEINNSVAREQQIWGVAGGAISGATSGAITGGMVGGPVGAVVGGILGAGTSTAAGIRDVQLQDVLRQESIDYTKDQFGYTLGNIQALPNGLAKVSAYTFNNKIFPFVEKYTCTIQEREALQNKLKYNGMTVMRIGSISEFKKPDLTYIKGKLIRLELTNNDYHLVNEIANEMNKGVFI